MLRKFLYVVTENEAERNKSQVILNPEVGHI